MSTSVLSLFKPVKAFVFDIDGVLTNGELFVNTDGKLLRTMNVKDGYALQLAIKKNYIVWIISGGDSTESAIRLKNLGVDAVFTSVTDKAALIQKLMQEKQLHAEEVLFMGDDMPDKEAMQYVGLATCPQDACEDIKNISLYVSPFEGGRGCVRDVIEKVLKIQGLWM